MTRRRVLCETPVGAQSQRRSRDAGSKERPAGQLQQKPGARTDCWEEASARDHRSMPWGRGCQQP